MNGDDRGAVPDDGAADKARTAVPAPSQIGEALWRGRLRMGLSLEDVARRTGFDLPTVRAIENSDFAHMPGASVTIAAARAYARIVHLREKWVALTLAAELARIAVESLAAGASATGLS